VFRVGVLTPTPEGVTLLARGATRGAAGWAGGSGDLAELAAAGLVAAGLRELGAADEHAVELIDQEGDGLVALVGGDGGVHVGPVDGDVAFGGEAVGDILLRVALELHPEADDALLVPEEAFRLVLDELLQGRGELEVDAGYDQVVGVVHFIGGIWVYLGQNGCEAVCMRTTRELLSEYAVIIVTGGSSGIGKAFIEHVTRLNSRVVICNLSRRRPDGFSGQLNLRHVPVDLSDAGELAGAAATVLALLNGDMPLGKIMLVNNSGFGGYGRSDEQARADQVEMIDLNVRAVVDLTARLLPALKAHGGAVVNIASTAAFQPTPFMATYGATKAFVLHWSLALGEDLRGSGVEVLAVCPGPTSTEFFKRAGLKQGAVTDNWGQTSEEVVAEALRALARGRRQVVTGWKNRLVAAFASRLPKPLAARVGAAVLARFRMSRVAAPAAPASAGPGPDGPGGVV
jgi:uncharacterized protein